MALQKVWTMKVCYSNEFLRNAHTYYFFHHCRLQLIITSDLDGCIFRTTLPWFATV